jgi:hypothetical protein
VATSSYSSRWECVSRIKLITQDISKKDREGAANVTHCFSAETGQTADGAFSLGEMLIHVTPFHTVSWAASKTPEVASATPMRHPVTSAILMNIRHLRK